ncbi:MAG: hypothetical protein V4692_15250 [Bdellovibrionota bacterium]
MIRLVLLVSTLAFATFVSAAVSNSPFTGKLTSKLQGLVEVPDVFGEPDPKRPADQKANPDSKPIPLLVSPSSKEPPLFVDAKPSDFISAEHDYEMRSAAVYEKRKDWYRIATVRGDAWIPANRAGAFHGYEKLVKKGPNYLTPEWDRQIFPTAAGKSRAAKIKAGESHFPVKILSTKVVGKDLWYQVRLIKDACEDDEPEFSDEGWVRGISEKNLVNVWFFSRGC